MAQRKYNLLLLAAALVLLVGPAAAEIIEVAQGDTVYWNETADLRLAAGWDCTLAYWYTNHSPGPVTLI